MQHIIERELGSYQYIESGNQYYYYCPKCQWKNPRLSVNYDKNVYHCWYCGFSGKSLLYLLYYVNADQKTIDDFKEFIGEEKLLESSDGSISQLKKDIYDILEQRSKDRKYGTGLSVKESWTPVVNLRGDFFGKRAYTYLRNRKLSPYEMKFYNVMVDEEDDTLIFPSYNREGFMNYYVKHDYLNRYYINAENVKKSNIIFFESYVNFKEPVIITEGVYDAINIGYNAIPILGTLVHNALIDQLVINDTPIVYIFLDGDAKKSAFKIYEYLKEFSINAKVVEAPKGEDGNSLARCDIKNLIQNSKKYNFNDIINLKIG